MGLRPFPFSVLSQPRRSTTRDQARRRPDLPQSGESFADYQNRTGGAPLQRFAEERRQQQRAPATRAEQVAREQADVPRYSFGHVGEAWHERQRREWANVWRHRVAVDDLLEGRQTRWEGPQSMAIVEIPRALDPMTGAPANRAPLFRWGVDVRRPLADVFADVERVTGAPDGFLNNIGIRESKNRTSATNDMSTARGAHQFIEKTWLDYMRQMGPRYGLPEGMTDEEILWLRDDARWSAAMTAEYARHNWHAYNNRLGRAPTQGDLYVLHFGDVNGLELLMARERGQGHRLATEFFGEREIRRNRAVFFKPDGKARTADEFYTYMTRIIHHFPDGQVQMLPRLDGSTDYVR